VPPLPELDPVGATIIVERRVVVIITPFGCVDTIRVVYVEVLDVRAVVGVGLDAWVVPVVT